MLTSRRTSLRGLCLQARTFATSRPVSVSLKINSDRLQETLHDTCKWGAAHSYGP